MKGRGEDELSNMYVEVSFLRLMMLDHSRGKKKVADNSETDRLRPLLPYYYGSCKRYHIDPRHTRVCLEYKAQFSKLKGFFCAGTWPRSNRPSLTMTLRSLACLLLPGPESAGRTKDNIRPPSGEIVSARRTRAVTVGRKGASKPATRDTSSYSLW